MAAVLIVKMQCGFQIIPMVISKQKIWLFLGGCDNILNEGS
mgnify:CR=1 FL=1